MTDNPLLRFLRDPRLAKNFSTVEWDLLLRLARQQRLLAKLGSMIEKAGLQACCPVQFVDNALGERTRVSFLQNQIHRELTEVVKALKGIDAPILLLKGAAYLESSLPPTRGRTLSDLDILVPRERLVQIENMLKEKGWESNIEDDYDQRYYREWMHEIPPLSHPERRIEVDIHHNLMPLTGSLTLNADRLWEMARPIEETGLFVLAPADMVLHSAVHLFFNDELRGGLRDLVDISELCSHFAAVEEVFYQQLFQRADDLDLTRPLYYALYSAQQLLHLQLPVGYLQKNPFNRPGILTERLIRHLFNRVLSPHHPESNGAPVSQWLLFVRSHLIRMPPAMLAGHLLRKSLRPKRT